METGINLTALESTITLSSGATIDLSGAQDFTTAVVYTVSAEDEYTTQQWVVTVSEKPLGLEVFENLQVYPNPATDQVSISGMRGAYSLRFQVKRCSWGRTSECWMYPIWKQVFIFFR